ncbi:MAG: NUDIX domain-containing protein [Candidatus Pacearchaeota archaeon]|jgi:ADP-ribose pyrophosphatase YjhB (NUDIX family)
MTKLDLKKIKKGIFLVNVLGIVFDTSSRKILIGKREKDPYVPKLTWSFPGGTPVYGEDLEKSIEKQIKEKTGLKTKSLGPIFARIPPEKKEFLLIYYLCEKISGKEKPAKGFKELKWVSPIELEKHATTSIDPRLKEYIMNLK